MRVDVTTLSVLIGSRACNAKCPFCVSQMTPDCGIGIKEPVINWRNFDLSCRYAQKNDISTVMLTGKGEPTLFPNQITTVLSVLRGYDFPFKELQTNGIKLMEVEYCS